MGRGAKGKYKEWITEDGLVLVEGIAREGLSDKQIAEKIGISQCTFYQWQIDYPEFAEAIKKGKAPVDTKVENALLKRALGYTSVEIIEEVYSEGEGEYKHVTSSHIRKITREIPPDTGAIAFWLKNRKSSKWKDRQQAVEDTTTIEKLDRLLEVAWNASHAETG